MTTLTCLVENETPAPTRLSIRRACRARGFEYIECDVTDVHALAQPLAPGSLLYSPATSGLAMEVEARLWQPGVGTIYRGRLGPLKRVTAPDVTLARCDLPVPLSVTARTRNPTQLLEFAKSLGGFPLIVRLDGGEGGERVTRADSPEALISLVDLLHSVGRAPKLVTYVPDAVHVRVVVVAGRAVAAYDNVIPAGDFRSVPSDDPKAYRQAPQDEAARLAIAACDALDVDLGGVDILRHTSGRHYVLEVNTPCYFPRAERFGADVSGPLVDALRASAQVMP
jgi:hypothetical protein